MKKLILLALVALVAGAAFAETAPAFSGDFEFYSGFDFANDASDFGDSGSATIALNGVVDEWSTVSAELSADKNAVVELNDFTLTTDITGALGVDGPVGVAITWGLQSFEPADYSEVAGYEDTGFGSETSSLVGMLFALSFADKAVVNVVVWPGSYVDNSVEAKDFAMAAELQLMLIENLDVNAYYTVDYNDIDGDTVGEQNANEIGLTAAYTTDMFEAGVGFDYQIDGAIRLGVAALASLTEKLALGVAFGVQDMNDFAARSGVAFNVVFDATDVLQLYGSAVLKDFSNITFAFDGGVAAALGGVTYTLGYDYNGAGFKTPDWNLTEGLYFKVSAAF